MSYDQNVFELGWDFIMAGERYRGLDMERVPAEEQHIMTGLFKQSTYGDIDINFAGSQGDVLKNCQAWNSCKGMTKMEAIKSYVSKSNQLVDLYSK